MIEKIVVAGFGGQGVLSLGQIIAQVALNKGYYVTWFPSYGAEMRGGTANCHVIYSDMEVDNPIVSNDITTLIAFNGPSLDKFESKVIPGGTIIVNSSVVNRTVNRKDCEVHYVDATQAASSIGNIKVQNMVMLGTYAKVKNIFESNEVVHVIEYKFNKKPEFIPLNIEALNFGMK